MSKLRTPDLNTAAVWPSSLVWQLLSSKVKIMLITLMLPPLSRYLGGFLNIMSMFQIFFIRFKYFSSELFWSNRRRMQNQSNCATLYIKWKVGPINWPPFFFPYLMKIHPTRHLVNTMLIINNKLFSEGVIIKICMVREG